MLKRRSAQTARTVLTRTGVIARAALFLVLAVVALALGVPSQPAQALMDSCDFTGDSHNHHADFPGVGSESQIPAMVQWKGAEGAQAWDNYVTAHTAMPGSASRYTVYELAGMRGLNWSMSQRDRKDAQETDDGSVFDTNDAEDCSWTNEINNDIAQFMFDGTKILSRAAISIKEFASNPSPLTPLYNGTVKPDPDLKPGGSFDAGKGAEYRTGQSAVERLNQGVFRNIAPLMILLTGIWVFTKLRKGDTREVWAGVAWAAVVVIAVTAFLVDNNHNKVVAAADEWIAKGNAALTEVILESSTGDPKPPCDLPDNASNRGLRVSSCAMYDTLVFRPWAIGQFGGLGAEPIKYKGDEICYFGTQARCDDLRVRHLIAQSITNQDLADDDIVKKGNAASCNYAASLFDMGDSQAARLDTWKECQWIDLRVLVAKEHADFYDQWRGAKPGSRMSIALYSIVAALLVGVMVVVLGLLTLLWHAVTLILVILLPLVASIAMHPTQQKLLKGWWETFLHSFVLRAGFGIILTVQLFFYQIVLLTGAPLGMQLLMLLLVTVAIVMMLKNLLGGKFSPKVEGADDALGIREATMAKTYKSFQQSRRTAGGAGSPRVVAAAGKGGKRGPGPGSGTGPGAGARGSAAGGGSRSLWARGRRGGAAGTSAPAQSPDPQHGSPGTRAAQNPGSAEPQQPAPAVSPAASGAPAASPAPDTPARPVRGRRVSAGAPSTPGGNSQGSPGTGAGAGTATGTGERS